jgi:S1-C subfamily serine protease
VSRRCAALAFLALAPASCGGTERRADPFVVRVEMEGATTAAEVATGFAVAPERVVTVAHVLEPRRRLVVRADGRVLRARVLRADAKDDLAVLAVPGLRDVPAPQIERAASGSEKLRILVRRGGRASAVAATLVRRVRATLHTPDARARTRPALQLRAHVALGDSGAAVVKPDGRLAGVLFARASNGSPTAYAIDAVALPGFLSSVSLHLRKP